MVLQNTNPPNNIGYPNIDKIMAFDVTDEAFDPSNNEVPAQLFPGQPGDEPPAEPVGREPGISACSARTACGR